ncbi:MAG: hypothetical protein ACKO96_19205 [Flammeovirgaceae bacterium]
MLVIFSLLLLVGIAFIGYLHSVYSTDKVGQFGDSFGVLTSFFSGFTVLGLLITIHLQRRDLEVARESLKNQLIELKQTRDQIEISNKELELSRKEFQKQNQTLKRQRFESTFFNMLSIQIGINKDIQIRPNISLEVYSKIVQSVDSTTDLTVMKAAYHSKARMFVEQHFDSYFKHFGAFTEFICSQRKSSKSQKEYLRIYFAQISDLEPKILYYHLHLGVVFPIPYFSYYREVLFKDIVLQNPSHQLTFDNMRTGD